MQNIGRNAQFGFFADCMSFSLEGRTLRGGKSYSLKTCLRMSAHEGQATEASEVHTAERADEGNAKFSPNLIGEMIKNIPEPLHAQITMQTQTMNELIQYNLARTNSTAGPRDCQFTSQPPLTGVPGLPEPCLWSH